MSLNFFLKKIKDFFVSTSWIESFVKRLASLPLPYWATCALIYIGITAILGLLNYNDITNGTGFTHFTIVGFFELATYTSLLPYGLYIYWKISNEIIELSHRFPAPKEKENKSAPKIITIILFRLTVIYIVFYNWVGIIQLYSGDPLECAGLLFSVSIAILDLIIMLATTIKIIDLSSFVYKIRLRIIEIDILDLHPVYSISQATQKVSFYLLPITTLVGIYSLLAYSAYDDFTLNAMMPQLFTLTILTAILIVGAIIIFVVPVLWIHERIIETKKHVISEIGQRLNANFEKQDQLATQGKFEEAADIKDYIDSLISRQEFLKKISEWPWETRVFREFSAAILLPIILWIIQFYLSLWLEK